MGPIDKLRNIFARGAEERAADRAEGRARIGGLFAQPDYLRSYLSAATILVREGNASGNLNEIAVACAYQQRHVLELVLKTLIGMLHGYAENDVRINGPASKSTVPPAEERNRLNTEHKLDVLLGDLRAAHLRESNAGTTFSPLPDELEALVNKFREVERHQPAALRYKTVRVRGRPEQNFERSFPELITIPITEHQTRLEALVEALFGSEEPTPSYERLGGELDLALRGQYQAMYDAGILVE